MMRPSQTARRACVLTLAALAIAILVSGCSAEASTETAGGVESDGSQGIDVRPATVTRVVDGDTIHVRFRNGTTDKVRFIGVDTPESTMQHEPYGKEASAYTRRALDGRRVFLQTDVELRDRYGRLLAYIWLDTPRSASASEMRAELFNAKLLLDGYASVLTVPPNVLYADQFVAFQREARTASRGLWALPPAEQPQP